jgi:NADH-quinone oxidoreductase subunit K
VIRLPLVLFLSAALFSIGVYGVLARRNAVLVLMSIELMLNAVNINLVAFARYNGDLIGVIFTLFTISITVAEVAVGLAIVIAIFRVRRTVEADRLDLLRG